MSKRCDRVKPATDPVAAGPKVPTEVRPKYDEIWAVLDPFCREKLNDEYRVMCQTLLASLARKRPSPLNSGAAASWADGIVRAVGTVNFLGDKSFEPYMTTAQVDKAFGISQATGAARAKTIRDLFKMGPFDPKWTLPALMSRNPLAHLISVDGFIIDVRDATPEIQQQSVAKGIVPSSVFDGGKGAAVGPKLYTMAVWISAGLITAKFAKANPTIERTIQIRGEQTLQNLHDIIFHAFDRFDEHMYEFQFGERPMDPKAPRYRARPPAGLRDGDDDSLAGFVEDTTIDSLKLSPGRAFGYWFDFGDDWMHQIDVLRIEAAPPTGKYPKITERVGKSPPQYIDVDESSEEFDNDE